MSLIAPSPPPKAAAKGWNSARIAGYGLNSIWIILALILIFVLVWGADREIFNRYGPKMLEGLWVTATIVIFSMFVGHLLSYPIALARLSKSAILRRVSSAYITFFRGTPILAQLFLVYYGAGQFSTELQDVGLWVFFREAYYCTLLAFTLNTAAYQAELLRGAIKSIPEGQVEAAQSMGLPNKVIFWKIILPQALIIALRPLGNELILLIKASAIASVVTVFDLMGATKLAFSRSYDFDVYLWAAILYLIIVETVRLTWGKMERRLTRFTRPVDAE